MSKSVALIVTIALLAIGCDKDGAIVKSDVGSDQTLIISHDPNKGGTIGAVLPPPDSMLYVFIGNTDTSSSSTSKYFMFLEHDLNTNINGRTLKKYLDYGTLNVGGFAAQRYHTYYVVNVPDSGGIPAHKDTVDATRYDGFPLTLPLDPVNNKLTISGSNSTHINNFSTDISVPTQLKFINLTFNQTIGDNEDLHLKLNRVSPAGFVGFVPQNIKFGDSTSVGYIYSFFDYTVPTDEVVISKQHLEQLISKWNQDEVIYHLFVFEENVVGSI
ncbi:MAG TPA: hypothetical protein PL129_01785, partial [bacterium]|nr:hypothetical protein [bacterium]